MVRLIVSTVVRNLALTASFAAGAWLAKITLAAVGRDVTVIMS